MKTGYPLVDLEVGFEETPAMLLSLQTFSAVKLEGEDLIFC